MQIDIMTGLLSGVKFLQSPHFNARPEQTNIDMIVIHGISLPPNQFGAHFIEQFFCGSLDASLHPYFETIQNLRVSSHLLITREGSITQFVPFHQRAWHAGESRFQGRAQCNDFSIGIELEGTDDTLYEKVQYEQLVAIIRVLQKAYPRITRERVVGHSDIAPGRKTDPGKSFDWRYLDCLLMAAPA